MSTGIWAAAAGAVGQMASLDVSTNNLVNASTPGFRADSSVFRQVLVKAVNANPGTESLRYLTTRTEAPDMEAGQIVPTGGGLDVAIPDDKSLFVISTPRGERYTRAGNFKLRADGMLTTSDGLPVLADNRHPIVVKSTRANVMINAEGRVLVNGEPGPKLAVVTFANLSALQKDEGVALRAPPAAGPALIHEVRLETGAIELSNESTMSGMADEVNTSRQFDMTMKVVEAFTAIDRSAAKDIMSK
jgi:flagellar basal-body rod protein FlgF